MFEMKSRLIYKQHDGTYRFKTTEITPNYVNGFYICETGERVLIGIEKQRLEEVFENINVRDSFNIIISQQRSKFDFVKIL